MNKALHSMVFWKFLRNHTLLKHTPFKQDFLWLKIQFKRCSSQHHKVSTSYDIGQPTPSTHPHLFSAVDDITPGIARMEYSNRRVKFMKLLSESVAGCKSERQLAIISANKLNIMTNDIPYPFHQDTDFLYLTGLNEPDAIAVIEFIQPSEIKFLLFVKPKDPKRELWDGAVVGEKAAIAYFNADESFSISMLSDILCNRYSNNTHCIWYRKLKEKNKTDKIIEGVLSSKHFHAVSMEDNRYHLQMMRLIKSNAEIQLMRKSASIATLAFTTVIQQTRAGISESYLHARFDYECKISGAQHLSFPPVVAGGKRANTLHYISNNQVLCDGELVLMDAGCVYNGYVSDITRTWPVSGRFTQAQKELYQIVLNVQQDCLENCLPGISINQLHQTMLMSLGKRLQNIGLIDRHITEAQLCKVAAIFCPHHVGHYLGMDTHDTPLVSRGLSIQPGMAFTVEPGLYIPHDIKMSNVPDRYKGIGIRIEDDVVMTDTGPLVLTADLPKDIDDIECLMSSYRS